jgi:hypothetical protein
MRPFRTHFVRIRYGSHGYTKQGPQIRDRAHVRRLNVGLHFELSQVRRVKLDRAGPAKLSATHFDAQGTCIH